MDAHTDPTYETDRRSPRDLLRRHGPALAGHAARVGVWGIVHFAAALMQQVAELFAPFALVVGIGWYALPRVLGLIENGDGQMHDVLSGLADHVPQSVDIGGHVLTPAGLVFDGFMVMALAALLSTVSAVLARELYRR